MEDVGAVSSRDDSEPEEKEKRGLFRRKNKKDK
jgi:hypothetical protein